MRKQLLIVDGNQPERKALLRILETTYTVLEAADSVEALDLLSRSDGAVSAVLVDVGLPGADGFALLRQLRNHTVWASLPVVAVVGPSDEAARQRAVALGVSGCVEKPVQAPLLLAVMMSTLPQTYSPQQIELLDNLPYGAGLYVFDGKNLSVIHLNRRYWQLVQRPPRRHTLDDFMDSVDPADRLLILQELTAAIRQGRDAASDLRILCGDGVFRPFHVSGRIVRRDDGCYAVYAAHVPISDETMSIQAVLSVALQTMMSTQSDYSYIKDLKLHYLCCSRAVVGAAERDDTSSMVGKTDYDLFSKELADKHYLNDRRLIESGEPILDIEESNVLDDGKVHYFKASKYPLKDAEGNTIGIFGIGHDVTEAHAMRSQLELLTNSIPGGIASYEASAAEPDKIRLTFFSDGLSRMFGMTREDYEAISREDPFSLVVPEDRPALMTQVRAALQAGRQMDCVFRTRTDGGVKWVHAKAVRGEPSLDRQTVNAVLFDVTDQQEAMERLRISEEENLLANRLSGSIVCRYTVSDKRLSMTPEAAAQLSLPQQIRGVPEEPLLKGMIAPESVEAYHAFFNAILQGEHSGSVVFRQRYPGDWRWVEARSATVFSAAGQPVKAVIFFEDVTERLEKEAIYRKWKQSFSEKKPESYTLYRYNLSKNTLLDAREGSLLTFEPAGTVYSFNQRAEEYAVKMVAEEDREAYITFANADRLLAAYHRGERTGTLEYRELCPVGGVRWLRLTVELVEYVKTADVEAFLMYEDIDQPKKAELQARQLAQNDPLTGVLNRKTFFEEADALLRKAPGVQHAFLMLDLDGFKILNDTFGHAAGDEALIDVAEVLRTALRRGDLLGRLGGDEFVMLLNGIAEDASIVRKANQLCQRMWRKYSAEVSLSASIGVAVCPRDGTDSKTLYENADAALYIAKGDGKGRVHFYSGMAGNQPEALPTVYAENTGALAAGQPEPRRRMLIVDDAGADVEMLSGLFSQTYQIEKAGDGKTALARLRHYGTAISVVLLDLIMTGMTGYQVLETMQRTPELRGIPVVVVSGTEDREAQLRAIRSGACDYITKPVDPSLIRLRVSAAVSRAENQRLRAENSYLQYQGDEIQRYQLALEGLSCFVVEYHPSTDSFLYDAATARHLKGYFDSRDLWRILRDDRTADAETVARMRAFVQGLAQDPARQQDSIRVALRTPEGTLGWFQLYAGKAAGAAGKIILTFRSLSLPQEEGCIAER